jgi:hypothetical protein
VRWCATLMALHTTMNHAWHPWLGVSNAMLASGDKAVGHKDDGVSPVGQLGAFGILEQAHDRRGVPTRVHGCGVIGAMPHWLSMHTSTRFKRSQLVLKKKSTPHTFYHA